MLNGCAYILTVDGVGNTFILLWSVCPRIRPRRRNARFSTCEIATPLSITADEVSVCIGISSHGPRWRRH